MALNSFTFLASLGLMLFQYILCRDLPLTPFGKKVKSLLPEETYKKIFSVNVGSDQELDDAIKKGTRKYYQILGLPYNENIEGKVENENSKLGLGDIDADLLFHAQTYAISKAFRNFGILNDDNIDELARKFVNELNRAARSVNSNDVASTFTAMTTAVANFLKSEGVTSSAAVKMAEKDFLQELKMDEGNKKGLLGKALGFVTSLVKKIL